MFRGPVRQVRPGTHIFQPGESARSLFFLSSGLVKLTDVSVAGDEVIVRLFRPGEVFGERCFLKGVQQYSATAIEPCGVLEMPTARLIEELRNSPEILLDLLGELSGRLAETDDEFHSRASEKLVVRLGAKLLALGDLSLPGGDWFELPHGFRHEELAQLLGVQRESVTRAIASLKTLGVIAASGRSPIRVHRARMGRFLSVRSTSGIQQDQLSARL
jgi:CRP-like cAMP-binding protein